MRQTGRRPQCQVDLDQFLLEAKIALNLNLSILQGFSWWSRRVRTRLLRLPGQSAGSEAERPVDRPVQAPGFVGWPLSLRPPLRQRGLAPAAVGEDVYALDLFFLQHCRRAVIVCQLDAPTHDKVHGGRLRKPPGLSLRFALATGASGSTARARLTRRRSKPSAPQHWRGPRRQDGREARLLSATKWPTAAAKAN